MLRTSRPTLLRLSTRVFSSSFKKPPPAVIKKPTSKVSSTKVAATKKKKEDSQKLLDLKKYSTFLQYIQKPSNSLYPLILQHLPSSLKSPHFTYKFFSNTLSKYKTLPPSPSFLPLLSTFPFKTGVDFQNYDKEKDYTNKLKIFKSLESQRKQTLLTNFKRFDKKCLKYETALSSHKEEVERERDSGVVNKLKGLLGMHEEEIKVPERVGKLRPKSYVEDRVIDYNRLPKPPSEPKKYSGFPKREKSLLNFKTVFEKDYLDWCEANYADDFAQKKLIEVTSDLTSPASLYPLSRMTKRNITYHSGPTNSGKTYNALQALKKANSGMYLGPLRLLALEVYEELTRDGVYCNLITGQEKRLIPFATHVSATVEMCREEEFEVVVVDEIQLLGDQERGAAWTRALMMCNAKEIHVCGGYEGAELVRKMAKECNDNFNIVNYERFNELKMNAKPLNAKANYKKGIREGDAVVAFSKNDIFSIRREIEENTDFKCCVIYGALPPESRAQQAKLFNDPDSEYKVLVASDAVGLGLNLNVRRVVFHTMFKGGRGKVEQLGHSLVKQIAGRAGRRNSPYKYGEVTVRRKEDQAHLKKMLSTDITPLSRAGLLPNVQHVEAFAEATGIESMAELFSKFQNAAKVEEGYFLCRQEAISKAASMADEVKGLKVQDKYTLCIAPFNDGDERAKEMVMGFAEALQAGKAYGLDIKIPEGKVKTFEDLGYLCSLHHLIDLYLWLSQRFEATDNSLETATALRRKKHLLGMITEALKGGDGTLELKHDYRRMDEVYRGRWRKLEREQKRKEGGGKRPKVFLMNATKKGREGGASGENARERRTRRREVERKKKTTSKS